MGEGGRNGTCRLSDSFSLKSREETTEEAGVGGTMELSARLDEEN